MVSLCRQTTEERPKLPVRLFSLAWQSSVGVRYSRLCIAHRKMIQRALLRLIIIPSSADRHVSSKCRVRDDSVGRWGAHTLLRRTAISNGS